ncbi:hypothetical protein RB653_007892 [Dictyostelium firmibasis]|uniref:Uncharacterized protein n=1 Tax=Dictyostelium firmibasis TaxID=79012 RepID=A0AAN7TW77_9MYCE
MKSINFLNKTKRCIFNFNYYNNFQRNHYCSIRKNSKRNENKIISLYSWGCSKDGKLGNNDELVDCEPFPKRIEMIKTNNDEIIDNFSLSDIGIKDVECGHYHTMIIDKNDNLYQCGWTSFVGINNLMKNHKNLIATSVIKPSNKNIVGNNNNINNITDEGDGFKVKSVSGGRRHTLILTKEGRVFSYGIGSEYQLGHGDNNNRSDPTEIKELSNKGIIKVVSGWGHSLALSKFGELYSWGFSNDSQTGHGFLIDKPIKVPKLISSDFKFKNVFSGSDFVIALTDKGELVSFGSNEFGQLGNGTQINQEFPTIIKSGFNYNHDKFNKIIESAAEGGRFDKRISCGFSHCLILNDSGELFTFGWNGNGQLGIGNSSSSSNSSRITNQTIPIKLDSSRLFDGEKIEMVSAGRNHSVALTQSGRLYVWGNSNHGKLGNGTVSGNQYEPMELFDFNESVPQSFPLEFQKVLNISSGFDHTIIELLEDK